MVQLIIEEDGSRREYTLEDSPVVVGRDVNCEIPIRDTMASRRHCEIRREGSIFVVEDLKSSNGTLVNGQTARQSLLQPGDVIRIGEVTIAFRDEADIPTTVDDEEIVVSAASSSSEDDAEKDRAPEQESILEEVGADSSSDDSGSAETGVSFEVLKGKQTGLEIEVDTLPFTLGRKAGNSFVIADKRVSGAHARVVRSDEGWELEDLGSGNGLVVAGKKYKRIPLSNQTEITLGDTVIAFSGLPVTRREVTRSSRAVPSTPAPAISDEFAEASQRLSVDVEPGGGFKVIANVLFPMSLLAILYFGFVFVSDYIQSRIPKIESGNRLGAISSFEELDDKGLPSGWSVDSGGDAAKLVTVLEGAPHGRRALEIQANGASELGFVRVLSDAIPIDPTRSFELGAIVKNNGFDGAGVAVQWLGQGGSQVVGESFTRLIEPRGTYSQVEGRVVAPVGLAVTQCRVAIFGRGSGSMSVDHVRLVELEDAAPPPIALSYQPRTDGQVLEFEFSDRGMFSIRGGRDLWVRGARLVGPEASETEFPFGQLIALCKAPDFDEATATLRSSFALPSPGKERLAYQLLARSGSDSFDLSYQKLSGPKGRPRLLIELTESSERLPVSVFLQDQRIGSSEALGSMEGELAGDEWVLGSRQRQINVVFGVPVRGWIFDEKRSRNAVTWAVEPIDDLPNGIWDVSFASVSRREAARVREGFQKSKDAREAGEFGRSIQLLKQLREDFSWKDDLRVRAATEIEEIESLGRGRLAELDAIGRDLEQYRAGPVFSRYEHLCREVAEQFAGTKTGSEAQKRVGRAGQDRDELDRARQADNARSILTTAESYFESRRNNLARLYAERALQLDPGPELKGQAEHLIRRIEARTEGR